LRSEEDNKQKGRRTISLKTLERAKKGRREEGFTKKKFDKSHRAKKTT